MIKIVPKLLVLAFVALKYSFGESGTEIKVLCSTTKGDIVIAVYPDWAPLGAARFVELVKDNFYTDIALFRSVPKFLTQFGISDKQGKRHWHHNTFPDDPQNARGIKKYYVSYAGGGKNTRSTQLFIAYEDLPFLGKSSAPWEVAFGEVIEGHGVVDSFYQGNGDIPPFGKGPDQQLLHQHGNSYIRENFPKTDFIHQCSIVTTEGVRTDSIMIPTEEQMTQGQGGPLFLPPVSNGHSTTTVAETEKSSDKDAFLRKSSLVPEGEGVADRARSTTRSAITAVGVLVIALFVLYCLYQYHSGNSSPKSQ